MKITISTLVFMFLFINSLLAQEVKSPPSAEKQTLTWSGFVKAEAMYDSRQVIEAREGYLLLYPKRISLDKNGKDINASGSFNQYAMSARLTARIAGPDILGAKVSALIEGDFTGASNTENNSFRLRHAYMKFKWSHSSILAGQYWHPTNVPEMIPSVLSLNTGAPFHPFSRQPQIRFDYLKNKFNTMLAVTAQRDYMNTGPAGAASTYMRNSIIPNVSGQLHYVGEKIFTGIGADFKRLTPRLVTDSLYVTHAGVNCLSYTAFVMLKTKPLTLKMQGIYGQGLNDHLVMGGYGVKSVDSRSNQHEYSPLNYVSGWVTVQTTGKKWQGSLFAGYTKGLGSKDKITGSVYARDADIAYVYRLAPMMTYCSGKLMLSAEIEFTTAAYGKPDAFYVVADSNPVTNTRLSFSAGYFF